MPSPEQLLSQLQALIDPEMGYQLQFPNHEDGGELEPLVWDSSQQGAFSRLGLLRLQGWLHELKLTDRLDIILHRWTIPEQVGSVNGEAWLVPEDDPAKILLTDSAKNNRSRLYQDLLQQLQAHFQHLQAFELSSNSDYSLVIVVGQLAVEDAVEDTGTAQLTDPAKQPWICLSPSVPQATSIDQNSPLQMVAIDNRSTEPDLPAQVQTALEQLQPIQLYGYYGGGYNQLHEYRLVTAAGNTSEQAIEQTLLKAGLFEQFQFEAFKPSHSSKSFSQLADYLQNHFSDLQVHRLSFWNNDHFYILGQQKPEASSVWGGIVLHSTFTYNP